jgi:hypothetical protein
MRVMLSSVPARRTRELTQRALTVVGTLALGYCLAVLVEEKFYQASEAHEFARELRLQGRNTASVVSSTALVPNMGLWAGLRFRASVCP